jgi:poly-gamma-glutamate capsule biosynthesis protein CapA/YwtB (metallophosphatase superfamily)
LEHILKARSVVVIVLLLGFVVSGCVLRSSTGVPTLKPSASNTSTASIATPNPTAISFSPTATLYELTLPLIMHSRPESTLVPELAGTAIFTPTATFTPTLIPTLVPVPTDTPTPTSQPAAEITLLFTGVIVPARCVQSAIDWHADANYIYDQVRDVITSADLAVGTLNTSLSDLSTHTGCIETYVLVSDSRSAVAATTAGFDVMSVATNHIKNCNGPSCGNSYNQAFFDTLDNLRANNILPVGAGDNMVDALRPIVVEVKGVRFGIVSLGMVEPNAFAGEDSPGIAELTDENLQSAIAAARQISDVVIAMPHWGPEDTSEPNSYQLHFAQVAVDAGADVVVGNHTHVVQAIQQINGIDVFYGLGNFVFDQTWDLAHQQGVILQLHFTGTHYNGYELIPTHVDGDGTVHIADSAEAADILQRIQQASDALK